MNAVAWGSILATTYLKDKPVAIGLACVCGFAFLLWAHNGLDLASDAQAGVGFFSIPVCTAVVVGCAAALGALIDRVAPLRGAA